jgi:hypothetical protein
MLQPDADGYLPDGRHVSQLPLEERESLKRQAYREAAHAAADESERERQRDAAIDAAAREKLASGLPDASALGLDVAGLGPARQRLVVGLAVIEQARAEVPKLEAKRAGFAGVDGGAGADKGGAGEKDRAWACEGSGAG